MERGSTCIHQKRPQVYLRISERWTGGQEDMCSNQYRESWHYLVRQWRQDGGERYLTIVTDGTTDDLGEAIRATDAESKPTHVYDTDRKEIVYSNY